MILEITSENFEKEVMQSQMPVLLDFWAKWCGPCRMLSPIIDEVAQETMEQIKVGKINVDDQQELATKFNIMSIPTIIYIKNGKIENRIVGLQSKETILNLIK